jgi:hypothetical protein
MSLLKQPTTHSQHCIDLRSQTGQSPKTSPNALPASMSDATVAARLRRMASLTTQLELPPQ